MQKQNAFFIGLLCSLLGVGLIGFAVYIAPVIFLGVNFDVPEFVSQLQHWYQFHNNLSGTTTAFMLFLPILIVAFILFFIARWIDNRLSLPIEDNVVQNQALQTATNPSKKSGLSANGWILLIIAIILIVLAIAEITQFYDIIG